MSLHTLGAECVGFNWGAVENIAKGAAGALASAGTSGAIPSNAFGAKKGGAPTPAPTPQAPKGLSTARLAIYVAGGLAALGILGGITASIIRR